MNIKSIAAGSLVVALATGAHAATVSNAASGLVGADVSIDFDEKGDLSGQAITDQFADLGVTFAPQLRWLSKLSNRKGSTGAALANFDFGPPLTFFNPYSIKFTKLISDATFALTGNSTTATVTALLDGVVVDSVTGPINADQVSDDYFGFTGSRFNEITIQKAGNQGVGLDNLSYNVSPVPLPAGLGLLALALGGLGFAGRRRKAS